MISLRLASREWQHAPGARSGAGEGAEAPARGAGAKPDAIMTIPVQQRRLFLEAETGSQSITTAHPDKTGAGLSKLERYRSYLRTAPMMGTRAGIDRRLPDPISSRRRSGRGLSPETCAAPRHRQDRLRFLGSRGARPGAAALEAGPLCAGDLDPACCGRSAAALGGTGGHLPRPLPAPRGRARTRWSSSRRSPSAPLPGAASTRRKSPAEDASAFRLGEPLVRRSGAGKEEGRSSAGSREVLLAFS